MGIIILFLIKCTTQYIHGYKQFYMNGAELETMSIKFKYITGIPNGLCFHFQFKMKIDFKCLFVRQDIRIIFKTCCNYNQPETMDEFYLQIFLYLYSNDFQLISSLTTTHSHRPNDNCTKHINGIIAHRMLLNLLKL